MSETRKEKIERKPKDGQPSGFTGHVHLHTCPDCKRNYSCGCAANPEHGSEMLCRDCEGVS